MTHEFVLRDEITVFAPIERCFLLSTSVEIVQHELKMRPVRGRTSGLVSKGGTIRWQGRQLGLPQFHESLIDAYEPPVFFRDRMIAGRFASFSHAHSFEDHGHDGVLLRDELHFTMPWGWAGQIAGALLLVPHIRRLLHRRFALLKHIAESDEWRKYLPER